MRCHRTSPSFLMPRVPRNEGPKVRSRTNSRITKTDAGRRGLKWADNGISRLKSSARTHCSDIQGALSLVHADTPDRQQSSSQDMIAIYTEYNLLKVVLLSAVLPRFVLSLQGWGRPDELVQFGLNLACVLISNWYRYLQNSVR